MDEDNLQNGDITHVIVPDKAIKFWSSGKHWDENKQIRQFVLSNNTESGIIIVSFHMIQFNFEM